MASFHDLTTAQLKQALQLREQIESLQEKLDAILGGEGLVGNAVTKSSTAKKAKGKRSVSPEARARMAAAQKARWSKTKGETTAPVKAPAAKKKSKMSPEAKAKIAAAMKARWAAKKKG